jgi:hypothetical protein
MWKRLVTDLGVAASLMLAAGCASSASSPSAPSSAPVPRSTVSAPAAAVGTGVTSASPLGLPRLTLRPASGPPGTHVTISGHLSPAQVRVYEADFQRPAYFSLITDVFANCAKDSANCSAGPGSLTGCELIVNVMNPVVRLDRATGRVSGSFTVGREGTCFQDRPTGHPRATLRGRYDLAIGPHASSWALFTVTRS